MSRASRSAASAISSTPASNGKPTAGLSVLMSPTGNALATASAVEEKMKELSRFFPANISYEIPYNITPVVEASIKKVLTTLVEAVVLVFVVMFVFLQNIRYTIIPTIVVPVALLGACTTLLLAGYSINMLSMFGMVLAVGILVDDAIVVVENVERIMAEEGLPPKEATRKAMSQITGAIIGITLVLMAVFVPMAFFPGSVGIIYRQFSVTMVAAIGFSAFLALSLTPALCATLLKPVAAGHGHAKKGVFGWFNRMLDGSKEGYSRTVGFSLKRTGRLMLVYVALLAGLSWAFVNLPGGFLPVDDQGFVTTDVQTPSDSSYARTEAVIEKVEKYLAQRPGVDNVTFLTGFSFSGQGMNTAQAFITLKDWSERGPKEFGRRYCHRHQPRSVVVDPRRKDLGAAAAADRQSRQLLGLLVPPPGPRPEGLSGPDARRRPVDRGGQCEPGAAEGLCRGPARGRRGQSRDRPREGRRLRRHLRGHQQHDLDQSRLELHQRLPEPRPHAARRGAGRQPATACRPRTSSTTTSRTAAASWCRSPPLRPSNGRAVRRRSPASTTIRRCASRAKPNPASPRAMRSPRWRRLAGKLPRGFGYEWTGQSLQEKLSGSQAPFLLALSVFVVFLCLAALYESWTIPLAVLLTVPLGIVGAVVAAMLRGLPNDVYFTVGLITIIGLAAKDAILIIEFAKDLRKEGKPLVEATIEACRLRFRPILMTGLAFICGVLPMAIAHGAGGASQQSLGTVVMGGMIAVVILALLMVPVFFVSVQRVLAGDRREDQVAEAYGPPAPRSYKVPCHAPRRRGIQYAAALDSSRPSQYGSPGPAAQLRIRPGDDGGV